MKPWRIGSGRIRRRDDRAQDLELGLTGRKHRLAVQQAVGATTAAAGMLDPAALADVLEGVVWRLECDHPSRCQELRGKLMDRLSSRRHGSREMAGTTDRACLQVMSMWLASLARALGDVAVALPRQVLPRLLALWMLCGCYGCFVAAS